MISKQRLLQKQRTEVGLCACGRQPESEKATCTKCLQRHRAKTSRRRKIFKKSVSQCLYCGRETNSKFRCAQCNIGYLKRMKKHRKQQRLIVLEHYGEVCVCCGEKTYEFLEIDHINGDGAKHRREIGHSIINDTIKRGFPKNLQILCANCNRGHGKFKTCPHKQEPLKPKSSSGRNRRKRRQRCIEYYDGKCVCCNEDNWAFLEFDHINNNGGEHRRNLKGSLVSWLINNDFPDSIQLLCSNCNKAKELYETCPHPL